MCTITQSNRKNQREDAKFEAIHDRSSSTNAGDAIPSPRRMLPSVIGGPGGCLKEAIEIDPLAALLNRRQLSWFGLLRRLLHRCIFAPLGGTHRELYEPPRDRTAALPFYDPARCRCIWILDLNPIGRPPRPIPSLSDDAFQSHAAGRGPEHDLAPARHPWCTARQDHVRRGTDQRARPYRNGTSVS